MGDLGGEYFLGGNHKIPSNLTKVPSHDDHNHPDYKKPCCMGVQTVAHGGKHVIAGCEAYYCEDDGDYAKCFNALGFVTAYNQPRKLVTNDEGTVTAVTCPPMVCMVKSATEAYYREQGLDPNDAGQVLVLDSYLLTHKDLGGSRDDWFIGSTIFKVTMPMCNMKSPETCVGYWKGGAAIRQRDIAHHKLNQDDFGRVSRAGYQTFTIQVIHLNSHMADKRTPCRKALRRMYERGVALGVSCICGDFNGCAYRPSRDRRKF
jgi:hypothetical protein